MLFLGLFCISPKHLHFSVHTPLSPFFTLPLAPSIPLPYMTSMSNRLSLRSLVKSAIPENLRSNGGGVPAAMQSYQAGGEAGSGVTGQGTDTDEASEEMEGKDKVYCSGFLFKKMPR